MIDYKLVSFLEVEIPAIKDDYKQFDGVNCMDDFIKYLLDLEK